MKESFNLRFTRDLNISLRMSVSLSLECMIGASHSERGYHLFGPLKELLGGKKFKSNEKVTDTGQQLVNMQSEDLYSSGIKKLPERWNKGIAVAEDYIERQCTLKEEPHPNSQRRLRPNSQRRLHPNVQRRLRPNSQRRLRPNSQRRLHPNVQRRLCPFQHKTYKFSPFPEGGIRCQTDTRFRQPS
ncbi:uncharacterized protein LOC120514902 isoform X1 [Polypterus senegalus]|uniref:uncharacterized protein LOC120514902 isoform X1 n=1 Tax=Polypterus senegalus TaxID=55291 RepID=UPI001962796F|nr:uncharacterized protein LOC120514902 isoform X1 [Polypterus senegalus]